MNRQTCYTVVALHWLLIAAVFAISGLQTTAVLGADNVEILYPADNDTIELVPTQHQVQFFVKFSNGYEPAGLNFKGEAAGTGEPTQFDDGKDAEWVLSEHPEFGTCHSVMVDVINNDFVNCKFKAIGMKQVDMSTFIYDSDEKNGITIQGASCP
ncbi:hypothetical protein BH23PLA1_BH23PLA1_05020 [soil metagenome]